MALRTTALAEAEAHARLILESSAAGLYGTDSEGRISFVNEAACQMLGYRASELLGRATHATIHHSRPDGTPYPIESCPQTAALREGRSARVDNEVYWRADGRPIAVEYVAQPMRRQGSIVGAVVSFLDITARREAETAREAARSEAERLARARSEFLANMSHEIRTPLNAVLGLAQAGHRESLGRNAAATFARIVDAGQHLLGVVNDVLDYSKIEAGKMVLEDRPLELGRVIDRAVNFNAAHAYAKGLRFDVVEEDLPERCRGDALRMSQVLINLLSNAVKFTERGRVALSARCEEDTLVFGVSDTGIGLDEEEIGRLFHPFEQADGSTTRRYGGTGLGLSISRYLAMAMGGRIDVQSQPGQGSRFEVRLPLREPSRAIRSTMATMAAMAGGVDLAGLAADEAASLADALWARGLATRRLPSAEKLDDSAGLTLMSAALLQDEAGRAAATRILDGGGHVVVVTTPGVEQSIPAALLERLWVIERPLRLRHVLDALAGIASGPASRPPAGPRLDGVSILAAEDVATNRLVLRELLGNEGARLVCVANGRQALERLLGDGVAAYDIVLTDIQMPVMDGYETARRIGELAADLPVVGLTAHAMAEERSRCLAAGMVEHVGKPIDLDALVAVIRQYARRRLAPGAASAGPADTPGAGGRVPIDWAALESRFKGKAAFVDKLAATALRSHGDSPARLRLAVQQENMAELVFMAHSLKGVAGNLMSEPVRRRASEAEQAARAARPEAGGLALALAEDVEDLLAALAQRVEAAGAVANEEEA